MSNISQYQFDFSEIAELLIKKLKITDGLWTVGVQFNIGVTNAGPTPANVMPSAIVGVEKILLSRATEPSPLTFDAASISEKK
jgi:hypothetical protein